MRIIVNGEPREQADGCTVAQLIESLGLESRRVAVERNKLLVPRAQHAQTQLSDGDVLEIVTLVGGG